MAPITAGSLIQRSVEIYLAGFVPFFSLALIFYSPIAVLQFLSMGSAVEPIQADGDLMALITSGPGIQLIVAYVVVIPIASASVVYGVIQGLNGQPATITQCIQVAASRGLAILTLTLMTVVTVGIGYLMCIVPGIFLTYGLYIAGPALIIEKLEPVDAMQRSWELTKGYKLVLCILAFTLFILHFLAGFLLNQAFGIEATANEPVADKPFFYHVLDGLLTVLFIAFNAIAAGVAYHDLKSLQEGGEPVAVFE